VVLRIDNSNSQKVKYPILIYNYGFIKIKYWIYNHSSPPQKKNCFQKVEITTQKKNQFFDENQTQLELGLLFPIGNLGGCSQLGT
jgi:hypothetical protein